LSKGNALYLFDDEIMQIYDISSSTNMVYHSTVMTPRDVEGVDIRGNILYYSSSFDSLLNLYDISDPFSPMIIYSKNTGQNNYWVNFDSDGYVYFNSTIDNKLNIYHPVDKPTISISSTTNTDQTTITLNASVVTDNSASTTDRGFFYGITSSYGLVSSSTGVFNIGSFSKNLTGLSCGTTYHYSAFATNYIGTATTSDNTFTTSDCDISLSPTVTSSSAGSITQTSATLNGNITNTGGEVGVGTDYGFILSTDSSLSSGISTTSKGTYSSTGEFSSSISSLTCFTTYYFKPYASNSGGVGYGATVSFTTSACPTASSGRIYGSRSSTHTSQNNTPNPVIPANNSNQNPPSQTQGGGSFKRNLSLGLSGEDVKDLQKYLNSKGYTLAITGPGSPGNETNLFGQLTKKALINFQKANGIYPSVGFFGPITRAFIEKK
jgi:hypothetical protein